MGIFTRISRRWSAQCCALAFAVGAGIGSAQTPAAAPMGGSAAAVRVGSARQGRLIAKKTCAAYHGLGGNAPSARIPKLAGQNPAYLYRQLRAFRTGARRSPVMAAIVASLSDRDMADAASYFALQRRRPDPSRGAGRSAAAERIFFMGIAGRVPACAGCHQSPAGRGAPRGMRGMMGGGMMGGGMMGRGMMGRRGMGPATTGPVPILPGQHAPYLIGQLNRFADGRRASPVMGPIAANMDASERTAVAAYLSATSP